MLDDTQPVASTSYVVPRKCILSPAHLAAFKRSPTHQSIVEFIDDLNSSIVDKTLDDAGEGSEASSQGLTNALSKLTSTQSARSLLNIIESVLDIAKAIPPVDNKLSRFGNPAFKTFFDKVQEVYEGLAR